MIDEKSLLNGEVLVYRRSSRDGTFQVRFNNVQGNKKPRYVRKSLKTKDEGIAISLAIQLYREHHSRAYLGLSSDFVSIERLLEIACEEHLKDAGIVSATSLYRSYWREWFDGKDCARIKKSDIGEYFKWRIDKQLSSQNERRWMPAESSVSTSTLKLERNLLRTLFVAGKAENLIARMPGFPQRFTYKTHTIAKDERRGRFTGGSSGTYSIVKNDFAQIRRLLNDQKYHPSQGENGDYSSWSKVNGVGSSKDVPEHRRFAVKARSRFARAQYWFLSILIANSGIRPSEVVKLRHSDISLAKSKAEEAIYTRIVIRREVSKVGKFRDVIASDFHLTFERYLDYCREVRFRFGRDIKPSDYVFPKTGDYGSHIDRLNNLIRPNLQRIGLHKKQSKSHPDVEIYYSAYSFRSWYITQRLENGLDIYTLAKNCGTSIKTIASTYDVSENWAFRQAMTKHLKPEWRGASDQASITRLSEHITEWE